MNKHIARPTAGTKVAEAAALATGRRSAKGIGRRSLKAAK